MAQHSGPYAIRRLALQVEMTDGTMMTFYADPGQAAGATVTVDMERETYEREGYWHPMATTPDVGPPQITFTVGPVAGYVMTMQNPADLMTPAGEIEGARKEIEP